MTKSGVPKNEGSSEKSSNFYANIYLQNISLRLTLSLANIEIPFRKFFFLGKLNSLMQINTLIRIFSDEAKF